MEESDINHKGYTFPPFPPAPQDATLIPFREFKERGIHPNSDEHRREIDGVGIPTVPLPLQGALEPDLEWLHQNHHSRQETWESNRKQWWQYWEEFDKRRPPFVVNPQQPQLDRILNAVSSFRGSRRWPFERRNKPGPKLFWDQFRIFIGASGYPPVWNRTDRSKSTVETGPPSPDFSDDENDAPPKQPLNIGTHISAMGEGKHHPGPIRPPYANYDATPLDLDSDEAVQALLELDKLRREEQLIDFLTDPERRIRVFLSSYSRDQSFLWSEDNLRVIPRLILSFLKFIVKNRFLPEPLNEHRFQNALGVAELALKELPFTSFISKFLPDEYGKTCREYWGSQAKAQSCWPNGESDEDKANNSGSTNDDRSGAIFADGTSFFTGARITRLSFGDEPIDQASGQAMVAAELENETASPYSFLQADPIHTSKSAPDSFKLLLSATSAFPLTHRPGLVEHSLRRIKHILPPAGFTSTDVEVHETRISRDCEDPVYTAEKDLNAMLVKMVLVPWVDSGLHGYVQPEMVIPMKAGLGTGGVLGVFADGHDPLEDEIIVLVSVASKNLDMLRDSIGMGLAATWVQLIPISGGEHEWNPGRLRYWYLDNLDVVVPSYWTR